MQKIQARSTSLRQISERMDTLQKQLAAIRSTNGDGHEQQIAPLRKELRYLIGLTLNTPARIRRRLAHIAALHKEHEAVRRDLVFLVISASWFPLPNAIATAASISWTSFKRATRA